MPMYTVILDIAGGTYISQVDALSTTSACVKWAEDLNISELKGIGLKNKELLIAQMKEEEPLLLDGLLNVWCATASLRGGLAFINIVQTERPQEQTHRSWGSKPWGRNLTGKIELTKGPSIVSALSS